MAVDPSQSQIEVDPYKTTIPMVNIPPEQYANIMPGTAPVTPAEPLGGNRGRYLPGRSTGGLAIGDAIMKGILQGHAYKAARKAKEAEAEIASYDRAERVAWGDYQTKKSAADADLSNIDLQKQAIAAYDDYAGIYKQGTEARRKYMISEKPKKGEKGAKGKSQPEAKSGGPEASQSSGGVGPFTPPAPQGPGAPASKGPNPFVGAAQHTWQGITNFFAANPHLVPQAGIALREMAMRKPGLDPEYQKAQAELEEVKARSEGMREQTAAFKTEAEQRAYDFDQTKKRTEVFKYNTPQKVATGVDENGKPYPQEVVATAREMVNEQQTKLGPEQAERDAIATKVAEAKGDPSKLSPFERYEAIQFKLYPEDASSITNEENGHQTMVFRDGLTHAQVGDPIDLGPKLSSGKEEDIWAEKPLIMKSIYEAVSGDPDRWGVRRGPNGDPDPRDVAARTNSLWLQYLLKMPGSTVEGPPTPTQESALLTAMYNGYGLGAADERKSIFDGIGGAEVPKLTYRDASGATQSVDVDGLTFRKFWRMFTVPSSIGGQASFRVASGPFPDGPVPGVKNAANPEGYGAEQLEAIRGFMHRYFLEAMQKGTRPMNETQARAYLATKAIGTPITFPAQPTTSGGKGDSGTGGGLEPGWAPQNPLGWIFRKHSSSPPRLGEPTTQGGVPAAQGGGGAKPSPSVGEMPSSAMPSGGGQGQPLYGVGGNGQPVKHWVVQSGWIRDPKTKQERFMTSEELDTYYIDGAYMTEEDAQKYMSQKDPKTGKPKWQFVEDLANVRPTGG